MVTERLSGVLLSSYASRGLAVLMPIVITPIVISKLGIEVYSLVGIFVMVQSAISLLDLGIVPTVMREMSRLRASSAQSNELLDTVRTIEIVYLALVSIAFLLGIGISYAVAHYWMHAGLMSAHEVAVIFAVMCVGATANLMGGLYSAVLTANEKQLTLNLMQVGSTLLSASVSITGLLYFSWSFLDFVAWQSVVGFINLAVFRYVMWRSMPPAEQVPVFQKQIVMALRRFSVGISGTQILAIFSMNMDRILLARLLPPDSFGYYTLAATLAASLMAFVQPITAVATPRLMLAFHGEDENNATDQYHLFSQMVCVVIAPLVLTIVVFSGPLLLAWTNNADVVLHASLPLEILALGWMFNALMYVPYSAQIANGWVRLGFFGLLISLAIQVPVLLHFVPKYGLAAAAWSWLVMELGFFLIAIPVMHSRILIGVAGKWYLYDTLLPMAVTLPVIILSWIVFTGFHMELLGRMSVFLYMGMTMLLSFVAAVIFADRLRPVAKGLIYRLIAAK